MFKNWANDSEVTKFLTWKPHKNVEETEKLLSNWIENYADTSYYVWAIVEKSTNQPIGGISVVNQKEDTKSVEIGYCIGKNWWRKGIMTEALTRLVKFFFEEVGANRVESRHDTNNPNSGKVMQKAGMILEGTSRQTGTNNQGINDQAHYAILAQDYFCKSQKNMQLVTSVSQASLDDLEIVTDLLCQLYNIEQREDLLEENKQLFSDNKQAFFLSYVENKAVGVAHVSLRCEYVNGTEFGETCGFLEGIFVRPEFRKGGVATHLLKACEDWAKQHGCREFASDCLLENTDSYNFHLKMGFTETERCIFFRKEI